MSIHGAFISMAYALLRWSWSFFVQKTRCYTTLARKNRAFALRTSRMQLTGKTCGGYRKGHLAFEGSTACR